MLYAPANREDLVATIQTERARALDAASVLAPTREASRCPLRGCLVGLGALSL
jgi:hypothetical protein